MRALQLHHLGQRMPVLRRAAIRAGCRSDQPFSLQLFDGGDHIRLGVINDWIPIRLLITRRPESIDGHRVVVGRAELLLDEAAQHPDLARLEVQFPCPARGVSSVVGGRLC